MKIVVLTLSTRPRKRHEVIPPPKEIAWTDSSDRKWLNNHLHWALSNGVSVALAPVLGLGYVAGLELVDALRDELIRFQPELYDSN